MFFENYRTQNYKNISVCQEDWQIIINAISHEKVILMSKIEEQARNKHAVDKLRIKWMHYFDFIRED